MNISHGDFYYGSTMVSIVLSSWKLVAFQLVDTPSNVSSNNGSGIPSRHLLVCGMGNRYAFVRIRWRDCYFV